MKKKYLLITFLLSIALFSQEKNYLDVNYIEVTGTAEIEIDPDEIYVNISILENDLQKNETVETKEKQMIERLKGIGVNPEANLQIRNVGGNFTSYFLKADETKTYKNYLLKLSTGKQVSQTLILLKGLNISSVKVEKTSHSKIEEYRRQVKVNATKIAKDKAVDMLTIIDDKCGKTLFIQELDNVPMIAQQSNMVLNRYREETSEFGYTENLNFEKIKLQSKILARFQILD